jgi:hypothetical protein
MAGLNLFQLSIDRSVGDSNRLDTVTSAFNRCLLLLPSEDESRPMLIRSRRTFSASTFFFISRSPITCHGGPPLFLLVSPKMDSFGLVVEDCDVVVDDDDRFSSNDDVLLLLLFRCLFDVFRCFPTLFGFLVFFFFPDFNIRVFLPCMPPLAISNALLARTVALGIITGLKK